VLHQNKVEDENENPVIDSTAFYFRNNESEITYIPYCNLDNIGSHCPWIANSQTEHNKLQIAQN
jgi:hypothetical protein